MDSDQLTLERNPRHLENDDDRILRRRRELYDLYEQLGDSTPLTSTALYNKIRKLKQKFTDEYDDTPYHSVETERMKHELFGKIKPAKRTKLQNSYPTSQL